MSITISQRLLSTIEISKLPYKNESGFSLMMEHIGLAGRYYQADYPNGDLQTMQKAARLLKPGGIVLLTIPVGVDLVFAPWHRVYGRQRLPRLLEGFTARKSRFFVKKPGGPWYETDELQALDFDGRGRCYALGEYVLQLAE